MVHEQGADARPGRPLVRLFSPLRAMHAHIRASHFTAPAVGPPYRLRATERTCQIGRATTLTVLFVLVALIAVIPRTWA